VSCFAEHAEPEAAHNYSFDNHDRMSSLRCQDGPCFPFFGSSFSQDLSVLRFISRSISSQDSVTTRPRYETRCCSKKPRMESARLVFAIAFLSIVRRNGEMTMEAFANAFQQLRRSMQVNFGTREAGMSQIRR
jgi:hypothetical protein